MTSAAAQRKAGADFSDLLFEMFVTSEIAEKRRLGFEPPATNDFMAFIREWARGYRSLLVDPAREGFVDQCVMTLNQLLDEMAIDVGSTTNAFIACRDILRTAVLHFVAGEPEPYSGFADDAEAIFGSVREQVMLKCGLVELSDGSGFVRCRDLRHAGGVLL